MTGLLQNVAFVWCCSLIAAASEKVLPPENVRLSWHNGLYPGLTWTPPKHSVENCTYVIKWKSRKGGPYFLPDPLPSSSLSWREKYRVINGGFLDTSILTNCSGRKSKAVHVGLDDPDIPLSCDIISHNLTRCSWKLPASAQLSFFYKLSFPSSDDFDELRECLHYNSKNNCRTSCDLQMDGLRQELKVLLNGTQSNRTIRNVYEVANFNLNLPPLEFTVKHSGNQFLIRWSPPHLKLHWLYCINYTACENKHELRCTSDLFYMLNHTDVCSTYRIALRAEVEGKPGGTEWTPYKLCVAYTGPDPMLFAVVLIPLVLVVLVVLTLLCCRKNKEKIFPKVPQPNPELFKDLINNNNKVIVANSYLPKAEEECEVTLVIDPNQPQL